MNLTVTGANMILCVLIPGRADVISTVPLLACTTAYSSNPPRAARYGRPPSALFSTSSHGTGVKDTSWIFPWWDQQNNRRPHLNPSFVKTPRRPTRGSALNFPGHVLHSSVQGTVLTCALVSPVRRCKITLTCTVQDERSPKWTSCENPLYICILIVPSRRQLAHDPTL